MLNLHIHQARVRHMRAVADKHNEQARWRAQLPSRPHRKLTLPRLRWSINRNPETTPLPRPAQESPVQA